jgi:ribosomal protein S18 acetylase RimI-like enzyme
VTAAWRRAGPGDDDAVVSACLALNAEDPGPRPVSEAQVRCTLRALREEPWRGCAAVLEADGAVAGYALLVSFWSNELGGEVCTIDEVFVAPAQRGRGHATSLFELLAAGGDPLWPARPVALTVETTPANERARGLYRRLGFGGGNLALVRRLPPR